MTLTDLVPHLLHAPELAPSSRVQLGSYRGWRGHSVRGGSFTVLPGIAKARSSILPTYVRQGVDRRSEAAVIAVPAYLTTPMVPHVPRCL